MTRQTCPACGRHWTPPGPCGHIDGGEPCGYLDPVPDPVSMIAEVREELEQAKRRKGAT